jgi:hypothetical protein
MFITEVHNLEHSQTNLDVNNSKKISRRPTGGVDV